MSDSTSIGLLDKSKWAEQNITEQTYQNGVLHTRAPESTFFESRYVFGEKLGQGAFGVVQEATLKTSNETFACKSIKKVTGSTSGYEQVQNEIQIMKRIQHIHIVKIVEVFETPKKMFIVLELCAGGELVKVIRARKSCTEDECRIIIKRLADSISYLHRQGVVHRDIKPENVLLSNENPDDTWNIKLCDFGLATSTNACTMMENFCGTPLYMAPEILKKLGYSAQCDVWSIGIMILCAYKKEAESELIHMIQTYDVKFPDKYFENVSPAAKQLLELMLKPDPAKRITAQEILSHGWINGDLKMSKIQNNANVLDLMKSYNAERRLRHAILVVYIMVQLKNEGKKASEKRLMLVSDVENVANNLLLEQPYRATTKSVNFGINLTEEHTLPMPPQSIPNDSEIRRSMSGLNLKKNKSQDTLNSTLFNVMSSMTASGNETKLGKVSSSVKKGQPSIGDLSPDTKSLKGLAKTAKNSIKSPTTDKAQSNAAIKSSKPVVSRK